MSFSNIKSKIKNKLASIAGTVQLEEEINTLHYFLNLYYPVENAPAAIGALREMQLCDGALLALFDKICQLKGWRYWLDWGTLLGAYRHNGFIPWDDDMDIAMPMNDYQEAMAFLPSFFKSIDPNLWCGKNGDNNFSAIAYAHEKTGIWIDIFPYTFCKSESDTQLNKVIDNVTVLRKLSRTAPQMSDQEFEAKMKKKLDFSSDNVCFVYPKAMVPRQVFLKKEWIYPLQRCKFDNVEAFRPNMTEEVLQLVYGSHYMSYPKTGVLHHSGNRPPLSQWAELSGIDMDKVKAHLEKITDSISNHLLTE